MSKFWEFPEISSIIYFVPDNTVFHSKTFNFACLTYNAITGSISIVIVEHIVHLI